MPTDPTESIRRHLVSKINADPGNREALQQQYGQVWNTSEVMQDYEVLGFMAPYVAVRRKKDGIKGSLMFLHDPRLYFKFEPHEE